MPPSLILLSLHRKWVPLVEDFPCLVMIIVQCKALMVEKSDGIESLTNETFTNFDELIIGNMRENIRSENFDKSIVVCQICCAFPQKVYCHSVI